MEETAAFSGTVVNNPDASVPSGQIQPIRVNGAKTRAQSKVVRSDGSFHLSCFVDFRCSPSLQHLEKKLDLAQPISFLS